jgi:hypothetical protein
MTQERDLANKVLKSMKPHGQSRTYVFAYTEHTNTILRTRGKFQNIEACYNSKYVCDRV